jgi:hypothetical protein
MAWKYVTGREGPVLAILKDGAEAHNLPVRERQVNEVDSPLDFPSNKNNRGEFLETSGVGKHL